MLKRVVYTFAVLVAIVLIAGFLLPDSAHVERRIEISATPERIYPWLTDFRKYNQWQPWAKNDPGVRFEYTGNEAGLGARMTWYSGSTGNSGSQIIVLAQPPEKVVSELEFGEGRQATTRFLLQANGANTTVVWSYDTEFGYNVLDRYFGLLLDGWIGRDYEKGLRDLKALIESGEQ